MSLPPLSFTPREAAAVAVALTQSEHVLFTNRHLDWLVPRDRLVAAVEDEDDGLEQAGVSIEAASLFAVRLVLAIDRFDPERPVGCLDCILGEYSVSECAVVDLHAAEPASAPPGQPS